MLAGDAELEIDSSAQQINQTTPGASVELVESREDVLRNERLCWESPAPLVLQDPEQRLFDIFVHRISLWLDLFDPYQNFASIVPRLALWNVGLLHAILTLAARFESLQPNEITPERKYPHQYYHESLHYVREAMQYESYYTSDEFLATTIIISAYEMLDGSSRDWERHLQGVFWIQRSQIIHGDSGGLRAAIWWIWLCQDVWAAFRDRRKVFTFWKPERSLPQLGPAELASRSVFILGRVINYCARDPTETLDTLSEKMRQAEQLTALLDEWSDLLTPHFTALPHHESDKTVFDPVWIHPPMYGAFRYIHRTQAQTDSAGVAIQVHHTARILVLLHKPSMGGLHESLKKQSLIDGHVEKVGGIACTLTDYASSTLSSQCLYIGELGQHRMARS